MTTNVDIYFNDLKAPLPKAGRQDKSRDVLTGLDPSAGNDPLNANKTDQNSQNKNFTDILNSQTAQKDHAPKQSSDKSNVSNTQNNNDENNADLNITAQDTDANVIPSNYPLRSQVTLEEKQPSQNEEANNASVKNDNSLPNVKSDSNTIIVNQPDDASIIENDSEDGINLANEEHDQKNISDVNITNDVFDNATNESSETTDEQVKPNESYEPPLKTSHTSNQINDANNSINKAEPTNDASLNINKVEQEKSAKPIKDEEYLAQQKTETPPSNNDTALETGQNISQSSHSDSEIEITADLTETNDQGLQNPIAEKTAALNKEAVAQNSTNSERAINDPAQAALNNTNSKNTESQNQQNANAKDKKKSNINSAASKTDNSGSEQQTTINSQSNTVQKNAMSYENLISRNNSQSDQSTLNNKPEPLLSQSTTIQTGQQLASPVTMLSAQGLRIDKAMLPESVKPEFAAKLANEQISVAISKNVAKGQNNFSIRLNPAELGQVDIKLEFMADGKVNASMLVESEKTLTMLQRDQAMLEKTLQNNGLNLSQNNLNFSLMKQNNNDAKQQFATHSKQNEEHSDIEELLPMASAQEMRMQYSDQAIDISI